MTDARDATTHPHYQKGFPTPADRTLFGWHGHVLVAPHVHGYELFFGLCGKCPACEREDWIDCEDRRAAITVAGDRPDTVRDYLAQQGVAK